MMATVLLLIKFLAVAVAITVFDFVILIDGVKRDNFMIVPAGNTVVGCGLQSVRWGESVHSGCWWSGHPLNSGRGHLLLTLVGGT